MKQTFSLHKITQSTEFTFDPKEYSKFKFGCKDAAKNFGTDLAIAFYYEMLANTPIDKPMVVISSPYCFIPTATFAMKDYFIRTLNELLVRDGHAVVQETKIHRTITYKEDYGELSAEDRFKLIQNDGFHLDVEFVKGKTLILLDDVKITGSHERVIERMLDAYGLQFINRYYVYYGEKTVESVDPKVENFINYFYVKSLMDLDRIIKNDNFLLNTRVVKYMLNYDFDEFWMFIQYQKRSFQESVYHLAIGNSYHLIEDYQANLFYLKDLLDENRN